MDAPLYAIYVTAGPSAYDSTYEWGGCHITIAGFQKKSYETVEKLTDKIAKDCFSKETEWKPSDYTIRNWKGRWTIVINSKTLNAVADQFQINGFKRVKGPTHSFTKFHITLPSSIKTYEEAQKYANTLQKKDWFITVIENQAGTNKCTWCKYFPLKK